MFIEKYSGLTVKIYIIKENEKLQPINNRYNRIKNISYFFINFAPSKTIPLIEHDKINVMYHILISNVNTDIFIDKLIPYFYSFSFNYI
jgi:hypothetical protein